MAAGPSRAGPDEEVWRERFQAPSLHPFPGTWAGPVGTRGTPQHRKFGGTFCVHLWCSCQ